VQDWALEVEVCRILQVGLCISAIINHARKGVGRVQITLLAALLERTCKSNLLLKQWGEHDSVEFK